MRARVMAVIGLSLLAVLPSAQALELDATVEAKRLEAGLVRLCGLWDWTVHSHTRNHREARSKIVLPSPQAAGIDGPSPSEIRIYGDAVYFRWDFPGGYQEDSMLLTEERRLEGTFRTSTGSVGAITGKRVSACQATGPGAPGGAGATESKP